MQYLFFIGHDLHPSIDCFSLVTFSTHAGLVFLWSRFPPMQGLFFSCHVFHPCSACFSLVTVSTHAVLVFLWSRFPPMQCLFFFGHGFHPCSACFSLVTVSTHTVLVFFFLVTVYTHEILILHWKRLNKWIASFPVVTLLILSTAGCICQQYPSGSSLVKMICYTLFRLRTVSKYKLILLTYNFE